MIFLSLKKVKIKPMKKNLILPVLLLAFGSTTMTSSCKKKGCTYEDAQNYNSEAGKDDGSCTFASTEFIGTYALSSDCYYSDESTYSLEVTSGPTPNEVVLKNLNNEVDVLASISDGKLSFKEDKSGITYEGTGYVVDKTIWLNFEICETFYYPCSDPDACSATGSRN